MILLLTTSQRIWLQQKLALEKNAAKNPFFAKVWQSQKDFADIAVPFWAGSQMSNAKLGMAHAETLK